MHLLAKRARWNVDRQRRRHGNRRQGRRKGTLPATSTPTQAMRTFLILILTAATVQAMPLIDAIRAVESPTGKPGDNGRSRSHWQLSRAAWDDVNRQRRQQRLKLYTWRNGTRNEYVSKTYARAYVDMIATRIARKLKRPAQPREIYAAYNWGITNFARIGYRFHNAPHRIRERAQRVQNLTESTQ